MLVAAREYFVEHAFSQLSVAPEVEETAEDDKDYTCDGGGCDEKVLNLGTHDTAGGIGFEGFDSRCGDPRRGSGLAERNARSGDANDGSVCKVLAGL